MLGSAFSALAFSLMFLYASASVDKSTALKFGDDGYSVISFRPNMSPLAEEFSFCVWVNKLRSGTSPVAFAYQEDELFIFDHGRYRLFGTNRTPSRQIPMSEWSQFCGTWSLASQTFRAYINGTLADTLTTSSGRKLQTGGTLVLGDYRNPYSKGISYNHFAGEMYSFNMFSKELTSTEVAALSAHGLCTLIPDELESYRVIKWDEILKLERKGTVQDISTGCQVASCNEKLQEAERKLLVKEGKINTTKTELEETAFQLNETKAELDETKEELERELNTTKAELEKAHVHLNETKAELNETKEELEDKNIELSNTKQELKRVKETKCTLEKGNLTKWDLFYSSAYHNQIFTLQLYEQLQTTWDSLTKSLVDTRMTDEVIELLKRLDIDRESICNDS